MWLLTLASTVLAAELHVDFTTGEGVSEDWTQGVMEATTRGFGPVVGRGKRSVVYNVTLPPTVYDPMKDAFRVEVTVCREWAKGSKSDRDCMSDVVYAPLDASKPGVLEGVVKASDKFEFSVKLYYTGETPIPPGIPQKPEEPVPEAE